MEFEAIWGEFLILLYSQGFIRRSQLPKCICVAWIIDFLSANCNVTFQVFNNLSDIFAIDVDRIGGKKYTTLPYSRSY